MPPSVPRPDFTVMNVVHVFGIALGLSMDCMAVAVAAGLSAPRVRAAHALRIGLFFGGFQAVMPVLGWCGAAWFRPLASGVGHWIAFGLLAAIGLKMMFESSRFRKKPLRFDPANLGMLLALSMATSIDALAAGAGLAVVGCAIAGPALIIGGTAFALSVAGVYVGRRFGSLLESRVETAGGAILIAIGVKMLLEGLGII